MAAPLEGRYAKLTRVAQDLKSVAVSTALYDVISTGVDFLRDRCARQPLRSKVSEKEYFDFQFNRRASRPINAALFDSNITDETWKQLLHGDTGAVPCSLLSRALYTGAMAYCATTDLTKKGDQKTPGTFFECYIGHLVARRFGVNPEKHTSVPSLDLINTLPTDYVFNLGSNKRLVHLPVKTSTRERVVQVWAHQRVLDGLHGRNRFRGLLVCLAETNKQKKERAVIEVCLPGQWAVYQMHIAELHRVYYLDIPEKYIPLKDVFPFIHVTQFADFFDEADSLVAN